MNETDYKRKSDTHDRLRQRLVKSINVLLIVLPFSISMFFFYSGRMRNGTSPWINWIIVLLFAVLYYSFAHLYSGFLLHLSRISELIYAQFLAISLSNVFLFIVLCLLSNKLVNAVPVLLSFAAEFVLSVLWCVLAHQWYFRSFNRKKTVIVWDDRTGLEELIHRYSMDKHFNIIKIISVQECIKSEFDDLADADVVFYSGVHSYDRNTILKHCIEHNIVSYVIPRIGDVIMSGATNTHLLHLPIQMVERYNPTPEYALCKRLFDIIASSLTLILLSPLLALVAIAIKCYDGGPVIYKQKRLTKNGKEFDVLKFRSMRVDAEEDGFARIASGKNDPRITPVGRIIREYRIDELPQLVNIIHGDMSIVGPRPERPELSSEYEKTIPEFRLRLQVKAGLTGYAQVYGKYNTQPYDKLLMDLMYIARPSFSEDFKIIFATIKTLFAKEQEK